jgi:KaiC/GvpD/RAD55 family RecA-like ATPase
MERVKSGIPGFDKVIDGGFVKNSANLLCGGTGTGKTIFSMQFILNGASQYNERGFYISFEETEESLKADIEALGMDYDKLVKQGNAKIRYVPLFEVSNFAIEIKKELEKFKPSRVVIDSISAITMPMDDDFERRKQIYKIINVLKDLNCTSILISETPSESALSSEPSGFSKFGIEEFMADSVIVLHYAGMGGESDRAVRVMKMRRTNHLKGPIPMEIGKSGMTVLKSRF